MPFAVMGARGSQGTLVRLTLAGTVSWVVPGGVTRAEVLMVGSPGRASTGGGGGGAGVIYATLNVTAGHTWRIETGSGNFGGANLLLRSDDIDVSNYLFEAKVEPLAASGDVGGDGGRLAAWNGSSYVTTAAAAGGAAGAVGTAGNISTSAAAAWISRVRMVGGGGGGGGNSPSDGADGGASGDYPGIVRTSVYGGGGGGFFPGESRTAPGTIVGSYLNGVYVEITY
jgi:hypothetical protein